MSRRPVTRARLGAALHGSGALARALRWVPRMHPTAAEPIVLVDDDPEMRAMLRDFLAGVGFQVAEAGDTEALLALVPHVAPAAIIRNGLSR